MFNFFKNTLTQLFGTKYDKDVKKFSERIPSIQQYEAEYQALSNDELRNKTLEFKERIKEYLSDIDLEITKLKEDALNAADIFQKEKIYNEVDSIRKDRDKQLEVVLNNILPEAFAVIKETSRRFKDNTEISVQATEHDIALSPKKSYLTIQGNQAIYKNSWTAAGGEITWNMLHYDVQLIGGMALHEGNIAEMATGEGKTLVATLPAYLNALAGEGVHIITVNDYLARRDSEWIGPIFEFLMLTVDCIDKYKPHTEERRKAYLCDITYGTNAEFGFDYLRDNMVISQAELVQRKHHYAMVDEVDSVLIDDARTPLIISGPVTHDATEQEYMELKPRVEKMLEAQRKLVTEYLTEAKKLISAGNTGPNEGEGGLALFRAYRALPKYRPLIKYLSEEGIKVILQKTENFYMQEQSRNMHKADQPLYFTIDEKNRNVELTDKGSELLSATSKDITDPHFFIMPDLASEMNDIDQNSSLSKEEKATLKDQLAQDFSLKSRRLHSISQLLKAYTLFEKDVEYVVLEGEVKIVDEQTGRIMDGRRYSDGLHQAIEAKEDVEVGEHTQTYATVTLQNYFRMYHKLAGMTGTAETEAGEFWEIYKLDVVVIPTNRDIVRDDREDLVYKTSREKFNAVIDEIVALSNAGRPVLVGTTSVEISELLSRMLKIRGIPHNVLNAKQHQREAEVVAEAGLPGKVTIATNMAGRGTDIKISDEVKASGGLAIIGTERHDSRRVDRQLRGRAGRQGDPGTSQFYVSLEDDLMRLFQSDRIAKIMDRLGHKDGDVIQAPMVTKSIERAQKKVEENNFGIRKRLLDYDDVMNIQREAIYKKRGNALSGERLNIDIDYMFNAMCERILIAHKDGGDFQAFVTDTIRILGISPDITSDTFFNTPEKDLLVKFQDEVKSHYYKKGDNIGQNLLPLIQQIYTHEGHRYKRISLPFEIGSSNPMHVSADLKDAVDTEGKSVMRDIEKVLTLAIIDDNWKEHLRAMDELKESVQSASFEQKDPLVIYKMEAFNLFQTLINKINFDVVTALSKGFVPIQLESEIKEAKEKKTDLSKVSATRSEQGTEAQQAAKQAAQNVNQPSRPKVEQVIRTMPKVGRNEPCPCGSGKKFKNCHGVE